MPEPIAIEGTSNGHVLEDPPLPPPPRGPGRPRKTAEPEPEPDTPLITSEGDDFDALVQQNQMSEGKIKLLRRGPQDAKFQLVETMPSKDFDQEGVMKRHGGGDYRANCFDRKGKLVRSMEFSIDYRCKGILDQAPERPAAEPAKGLTMQDVLQLVNSRPQVQEKSEDIGTLMRLQAEQADKSFERLVLIMTASQKQQADLMAAILSRPESRGPDFATALTPILVAMVEKNASGKSDLAGFLETFRAVKELTNGEEKEESMFDKIGKMVGPLAGALLAHKMGGPPAGAVPMDQAAQVNAPAPEAAPASGGNTLPPLVQKAVAAFVTELIEAARRNSNVDLWAEVIEDRLRPFSGWHDKIKEALRREDWLATLFQNHPLVLEHRAWFEDLRGAILGEPAETAPDISVAEKP